MDWKKICNMMRHAPRQSEMEYQKYIKDVILEGGLGWEPDQIKEQLRLRLGSSERLIPDIQVFKDGRNCFFIEVKIPGHKKTTGDVDQLISYMKQFETPVGIYWGDEIEVYWKTLGDGSAPVRLMNLRFMVAERNGNVFTSLFNEKEFCIDAVRRYKDECVAKAALESKVEELIAEMTSEKIQDEVRRLVCAYFTQKRGVSSEVVRVALEKVWLLVPKNSNNSFLEYNEDANVMVNELASKSEERIRSDKAKVQGYAYELMSQIIEKNYGLGFNEIYAIFGNRKNYVERIEEIRKEDRKRWFTDEGDLIMLADGTKVAISKRWGFTGNSKRKMDNLIKTAKNYGIVLSRP